MTKPFEAEARFEVPGNFLEKLINMGFEITLKYSFEDVFFSPRGGWKEKGKLLRVRKWHDGRCEVLFTRVEVIEVNGLSFKRSLYKEGKVKLYEGLGEECEALLKDMEFEECGRIKKEEGYLLRKGDVEVALERINGRWLLEIEVEGRELEEARKNMERIMRLLNLKNPIPKPVAEIFGVKC